MKKRHLVAIVLIGFIYSQAKAQSCCVPLKSNKDTSYVSPKLLDTNLFLSDLKHQVNLKSVFDNFNHKHVMGVFMYTFDINENGIVEPILYYNAKSIKLKQIRQYVKGKFNRYQWAPAYSKQCITCKLKIYLQLIIFIRTDENLIEIEIKDINQLRKIFNLSIPYNQLVNNIDSFH